MKRISQWYWGYFSGRAYARDASLHRRFRGDFIAQFLVVTTVLVLLGVVALITFIVRKA